jgi:hypothetical protein
MIRRISMEYIDGITLTAMLIKKAPLDLPRAREIAARGDHSRIIAFQLAASGALANTGCG